MCNLGFKCIGVGVSWEGEKDLKREEREKGLKRNMCDKRWGLFLRMFGISKNWAVEKVGGLSENKIKQHTCMKMT